MLGAVTTLILYASGKIHTAILLQGLLFSLVGPVPFLFQQWLYGKGRVIIGPEGIRFRSIPMSLIFSWKHIVSVQEKVTGPDNLFQRLLAGGYCRYVEVKLSRSPRTAVRGGRAGTDIPGIPG